eukprot:5379104-Pleurochrysis_carterae.AAC.3
MQDDVARISVADCDDARVCHLRRVCVRHRGGLHVQRALIDRLPVEALWQHDGGARPSNLRRGRCGQHSASTWLSRPQAH